MLRLKQFIVIFQPAEKGSKRPHHLANVGAALKFLTAKNVNEAI